MNPAVNNERGSVRPPEAINISVVLFLFTFFFRVKWSMMDLDSGDDDLHFLGIHCHALKKYI